MSNSELIQKLQKAQSDHPEIQELLDEAVNALNTPTTSPVPTIADYNGLNLLMAELDKLEAKHPSSQAFKKKIVALVDDIRWTLNMAEENGGTASFTELLGKWESRCWYRKFETEGEYKAHLETIDYCTNGLRTVLASQALADQKKSNGPIKTFEDLLQRLTQNEALVFFTSVNDTLGGLTPMEVLEGKVTNDRTIEHGHRLLAQNNSARLAAVIAAANAFIS